MTCSMPSELFEPQGVDKAYLSFLVNQHRDVYLGTRAIIRLSYGRGKGEVLTCQAATYKLIRLLERIHPDGLAIDGLVLWVDKNPDKTYIRHLITREQYDLVGNG